MVVCVFQVTWTSLLNCAMDAGLPGSPAPLWGHVEQSEDGEVDAASASGVDKALDCLLRNLLSKEKKREKKKMNKTGFKKKKHFL